MRSIRAMVGGVVWLSLLSACGGGSDQAAAGGGTSAGAAGQSGAGAMAGAGGSASAGASGTGDLGPQATSSKLDVLFVIDNSASMAGKQAALAASLPGFLARLTVSDIHLGVISTSLGSHGGDICVNDQGETAFRDDQAQLLPSKRTGLASYQNSGYLAYDATGLAGSSDMAAIATDLQAIVTAGGDTGCGYEAPLEAMYRFLIDPEPPLSVVTTTGVAVPTGVNETLLAQRKAFLRPESAVAIVILSDENDCSIIDTGFGWLAGHGARMPKSTAACATDPNDPCCRSCAAAEAQAPANCTPIAEDSVCKVKTAEEAFAVQDTEDDLLNLRCFQQKRRFGFDLLQPIERYSDGLSKPQVKNRAGALVENPLFATRDGKGPRSATLLSVSFIGGAPWQDLATPASLAPGAPLEFLDGAGLASNGRWPILIGDPAKNVPPSDPFMIESILERSGTNPLTRDAIVPSASTDPQANPINGHETNIADRNDLQLSCTFRLPQPVPCQVRDYTCECTPDDDGSAAYVTLANSPLCQPPAGGPASTTQHYGKGYPGIRELSLVKNLGERAVAASVCPKDMSNPASPDYAYGPAFTSLLRRVAKTVK